ncbi:site-specific integrase [Bradyrhizobium sp. NBAIM08]|uniref:tyrosine-type recombinase/integrase n=1 Tax=Bradyrhizobium sp. NBAIM08 TaxID=2793815 RepID=UPI001CD38406|nr:site-specific integrase [Bradyrhizobium sp. NBAIM08]MCA1474760.1 tyrosine-type recombinase/integrase [Bradyrhizobium sp. NBAIM08]
MKLTAKGFGAARLKAGETDKIFFDDDIPGFGLRVRAGGSRSWVFQYALGDKQRRMSLGSATPESFKSVKDADGRVKLGIREHAAQLHAKVKLGEDPAGDKTESRKRASDTFEAVAKKFLAAKKETTRPGTYTETERHILKHAKPLNGLQAAKISRRDIAELIGTIRTNSGPVAANRVRSTLSDFFGWAMSEGFDGIEDNPVLNTAKAEEVSRDRVLKDHELRAIWKHAGDDHHGAILKLMMLTGQRADEIASLRWPEITMATVPEKRVTDAIKLPAFDIDAIDLPAERTKNKRPHIVPLSKPAFAIVGAQTRRTNSDGSLREFVFGIGQQGFSGWSRCKERLDARIEKDLGKSLDHWRPHDLRRTMSTLMNDRLGILPHVVEAILNHVSSHQSGKSGVGGVYNRALYLRERVEALNLWADHLAWIVAADSNVTPLKRAEA